MGGMLSAWIEKQMGVVGIAGPALNANILIGSIRGFYFSRNAVCMQQGQWWALRPC